MLMMIQPKQQPRRAVSSPVSSSRTRHYRPRGSFSSSSHQQLQQKKQESFWFLLAFSFFLGWKASNIQVRFLVSAWSITPAAVTAASKFRTPLGMAGSVAVPDVLSLRSSNEENDEGNNNQPPQEYRSIAEVVGGLHGGKYQFGGSESSSFVSDDAFSGKGDSPGEFFQVDAVGEEPNSEDLPRWALAMKPRPEQAALLAVPSNANPMDGMVYSASFRIQNDERTWEKFYTKLLVGTEGSTFVELPEDAPLSVRPRSGVLAPRGGASNACDASKPYSDTAKLFVTQPKPEAGGSVSSLPKDLWLVVGTEEEQWTYRLQPE